MKKYWAACLGLSVFAQAATDPLLPLKNHVAPQIQLATDMGRVAGDERIDLRLVVHLDEALLAQTLNRLYGSASPGASHFLSSSEFAQLFDLETKRNQLKQFAATNGLTVDTTNDQAESLLVRVSGPARNVENAFHVQLHHYRKNDGSMFHAIASEPLIPAALAPHLGTIVGLSNGMGAAHPHYRAYPVTQRNAMLAARAQTSLPAGITGGTGIGGTLAPNDIKTIYGLNSVSQNGTGQTLALFELDGYTPSDITHYETAFGLHAPPITYVAVDGQANTPGAGAIEVTLDIELAIALAPNLASLRVYNGPNPSGIVDIYNKIATDNLAQQVSTSWGLNEEEIELTDPASLNAENSIFQRMAAQGQSIYAASGDCGSYDQQDASGNCITTNGFRVDDPASQPFVTGVGGTSLSGSVASPIETTWNEFSSHNNGGGGGVSSIWSITSTQVSYQRGLAGTASQAFRNVPDVSLNADDDTSPYAIYFTNILCAPTNWCAVGGTSAAAPLWAALTALINQARAAASESSMGFPNTVLYGLSQSANFNDITTGNNGTSAHYPAGVGYDDATGLGSFKGSALLTSAGSATPYTPPPVQPASLSNVYAYPNPWDARNPKDSVKQMTFANLTDDTTVKIFTLAGFWIKTLPPPVSGQTTWDLTNDSGQAVASGLYLYTASGGGAKVKGKVALIR